jgi:predicted  nucleic acid-binding Zn ribbon protein
MTSLIHDYADIRSRMRGELKAEPEPKKTLCPKCNDRGWVIDNPACPVFFIVCNACYNPKGLPSP